MRGLVRVTSHTANPEDLVAYGPLHAGPGGPVVPLAIARRDRGGLIGRVEGVTDRDGALALKGTRLCLPRERLPAPETDAYYHHDLIGLVALTETDVRIGVVVAVVNHGASDVLEIAQDAGGRVAVAFTRDFVPRVDLAAGRLVVAQAALALNEAGP